MEKTTFYKGKKSDKSKFYFLASRWTLQNDLDHFIYLYVFFEHLYVLLKRKSRIHCDNSQNYLIINNTRDFSIHSKGKGEK